MSLFEEDQHPAPLTQHVGMQVVTALEYSACSAQYKCEQQRVLASVSYISSCEKLLSQHLHMQLWHECWALSSKTFV